MYEQQCILYTAVHTYAMNTLYRAKPAYVWASKNILVLKVTKIKNRSQSLRMDKALLTQISGSLLCMQ